MNITQDEWDGLDALTPDELKSRVFSILQDAAVAVQESEPDDPTVLTVVPRLADLIERHSELASFREVFSTLARATGLWNYIDREHADLHDAVVADAVTADELGGITFHREQIAALNTLLAGRNLVLSAPTSFGKSILIDALLASGRYHRVAIVLPTIALLDEFRRRLVSRFGGRFQIVMYPSESGAQGDVVFLGTQERLLNRDDTSNLDLAVVDEFYKLDPARRDERSLTLNAAVYQLLRKARQFFFLGPNIESVQFSSDSRWRFEFLRTRFSTVAVSTFDLRGVDDKEARLVKEASDSKNWPTLVFASAPDRANRLANQLIESGARYGDGREFSRWLDHNFGGQWDLSSAVAAGVAVHHGRIPRAIASHFVRQFNLGNLPVLICTSTLIEGVNTAAKSVMIYDKAINREDFDFFTFSNIRGRAGRLGQHHVGRVFLFHSPPAQEATRVSSPLFGDIEDAPDDFVVHITDEDAPSSVESRVADLARRLELSPTGLRLAATIGIETAFALKEHVERSLREGNDLVWSGRPTYDDLVAVCSVICRVKRPRDFGLVSAKQVAYFINQLRIPRRMRDFFAWYSKAYSGSPTGQDNIFKFLRSCEYGLPQLFGVVELFVKRVATRADYGLLMAELPRWFRPEILKNLDEQGVPIQISERFYSNGDTVASLSQRLVTTAEEVSELLSGFEREWILDALPGYRGGNGAFSL